MNNHRCPYCGAIVHQIYKGLCPQCPEGQQLIRMDSPLKKMNKDQAILLKKVENCSNALQDIGYNLKSSMQVNKHDLRITNRIADRIQSFIVDMEDILSFSKKN